MRFNFRPVQTHIGANDDKIARLAKMSRGSIDADHARTARPFDCIGGKAVSVGDIVNLNALVDQDAGGVEKIAINGDGTLIIKVGFGDGRTVKFCF